MTNRGIPDLFGDGEFHPIEVSLGHFGTWSVVSELGEGGYGKTFQALSTSNVEEIALKIVRQEFVDSPEVLSTFEKESAALRSLSSEWIVRILGSGVAEGFPWIATEVIDGPTLWDELQSGRLTEEKFISLVIGLTGALVDAHESKISHNDIKPSNIMFNLKTQTYVVIDLGIGQFQRIKGVRHSAFLGTPFYASPEQHRGRSYTGSDVYSAGVVLLEALTGSNRLSDEASSVVIASGVAGLIAESERIATTPVKLDQIDRRFVRVLTGMLDRDPIARFTAIQARHEWEIALGLPLTQTSLPTALATPSGLEGFASGKIQFDSWREIESTIGARVELDGFDGFSLDVNTSSKMVVNFRVSRLADMFVLTCPATANRANMRSLGWRFDAPNEAHSKRFDESYPTESFARDITAALQIGFGIRLAEVGLLL
jgi:serine/threonine protein kinase